MKKGKSKPMTSAQKTELKSLAALLEDQINTAALPEQQDWSGARRGVFSAPSKSNNPVSADLIDWFKTHAPNGEGYQTRINSTA